MRSISVKSARDDRLGHIQDAVARSKVLDENFCVYCHNELFGNVINIFLLHSLWDDDLESCIIDVAADKSSWIRVMKRRLKGSVAVLIVPSDDFFRGIDVECIDKCGGVQAVYFDSDGVHVVSKEDSWGLGGSDRHPSWRLRG